MTVTYKKLFELLIGKDKKKQVIAESIQFNPVTISKMVAGKNATIEVVEKVCRVLDVKADDICELVD